MLAFKGTNGKSRAVYSLAFSSDGRFLASGDYDGMIELWQISDRELLQAFKGHKKAVWDLAFDHKKKTFISVSSDKLIKQWPKLPMQN